MSKPNPRSRTATPLVTAVFLMAAGVTVALGMTAVAVPAPTVITVTWAADDMGFNATSSKDLSNIIVQFCDGSAHKHEAEFVDPKVKFFNHTETQLITGIWVKSGDNHDPEGPVPPAPFNNPGAGEYFANEAVQCTTTTTTATTSATTTATTRSTAPPTTEIPFFPTATAFALGTVGALVGAFAMMRRRN